MRRADRLFAIIQALRGGRVRRAEDIAAALEVSVRTVYRDLADLQAHGVPIDGERGVGYLLRDGYFLPPLALDAVEWDALRWGIAYVEAHGDLALAVAARTGGVKLAAAGRQPDRASLSIYARPNPPELRERIATLRTAIVRQRVVALAYSDKVGRATERRARPLELQHWGGATWTLTAWCELRSAFRVFRLDRIAVATLTDDSFAPEPGRRMEDYRAAMAEASRLEPVPHSPSQCCPTAPRALHPLRPRSVTGRGQPKAQPTAPKVD